MRFFVDSGPSWLAPFSPLKSSPLHNPIMTHYSSLILSTLHRTFMTHRSLHLIVLTYPKTTQKKKKRKKRKRKKKDLVF